MSNKDSNTSLVSTEGDENNAAEFAAYLVSMHKKLKAIERILIKETPQLTSQQLDILSIIYERNLAKCAVS